MAIIAIVAIDRNRAIGKGGTIPWHYSSDLKFFKQQTLGHACVMGRRTWASLKKPLKDRLNIVLSRTGHIEPQPGVLAVTDKETVLALAKYLNCDLYIIGGEQIYSAFAAEIDRWVVTEVPIEADGADTFLPQGFLSGFQPVESRELEDGLRIVFYERNNENEGAITPS
jgi:dihydrofolate reductase